MNQLKYESLNECVSILEDYIREPRDKKKEPAFRALAQLERLTEATASPLLTCVGRPKVHGWQADGNSEWEKASEEIMLASHLTCVGRPKVHG